MIGPGSRKRLAQILANREATEAEIAEGEKESTGGTMETIENIENIKAEIWNLAAVYSRLLAKEAGRKVFLAPKNI